MDSIPIQFPDPNEADDEGLIAIGGELSPDFLLAAYSRGIFPWFGEKDPILWWSPNPRMVLFPDEFKISASLKQILRKEEFDIKVDKDFNRVISNCSKVKRKGQQGTWITGEMIVAYQELHKLGYAHSFEAYRNNRLVGGLYGISLGKAFFGESMFYHESNASKISLFALVNFSIENDFHFIDVQQSTSHLRSLGARDIQRMDFLKMLDKALKHNTIIGKWKLFD